MKFNLFGIGGKNLFLLIVGSASTSLGIYLELNNQDAQGSFLMGFGGGILLTFILNFFIELKSKNETASK
jgi:hypothetical protein